MESAVVVSRCYGPIIGMLMPIDAVIILLVELTDIIIEDTVGELDDDGVIHIDDTNIDALDDVPIGMDAVLMEELEDVPIGIDAVDIEIADDVLIDRVDE